MLARLVTSTIVFILISFQVNALTCERYRLDTNGFTTLEAAESYYPKTLTLNNGDFKPKGGNSKQMVFDTSNTETKSGLSHRVIFYLLPNGKLIAALQGRAGYRAPGQAKYKCDLNANELRELNKNKPSSNKSEVKAKVPSNSDTSNDKPGSALSLAKQNCKEIGFTEGTEKFGDCVLKLME